MSDVSEAFARFEAWAHAMEVKLHLIHEQTQATHTTLTGTPPTSAPSVPPVAVTPPSGVLTPATLLPSSPTFGGAPPAPRTPAVLGSDGVITGDGAQFCANFLGDNTQNVLNAMRAGLSLGQNADEIARHGWESDLVREKYANGATGAEPVAEVGLFVWEGLPATFDTAGNQLPGTYAHPVPQHYLDLAAQAVKLGGVKVSVGGKVIDGPPPAP